jgi:hypothetical protein
MRAICGSLVQVMNSSKWRPTGHSTRCRTENDRRPVELTKPPVALDYTFLPLSGPHNILNKSRGGEVVDEF